MNLDDKLEETEFLYFEHPEHNPQSIKDLVEDMISNFDKNQDKVINYLNNYMRVQLSFHYRDRYIHVGALACCVYCTCI